MTGFDPAVWQTPARAEAWAAITGWLRAIAEGQPAPSVFILSGPRGVGKTSLLGFIAAKAEEKRKARIAGCEVCDGTCFKRVCGPDKTRRLYTRCDCSIRGRVALTAVSTPLVRGADPGLQDLLIREASGGDEGRDARERLLGLTEAAVLLVDELGGERERPETWQPGLQRILDARQGRHTLFATNLNSESLAGHYDPRIADRLLGASVSRYVRVEAESLRNLRAVAS